MAIGPILRSYLAILSSSARSKRLACSGARMTRDWTGALGIPGERPAGVFTAGVAQAYINLYNRMPAKEVVILGSGDIGMIMARRLTLEGAHVQAVFEDRQLYGVYVNSVIVALITALAGTLIAYGGALVTARSTVSGKLKKVIDSIALVTNTIPGMVIGLAYLFVFTGTPLQNTFPIIIICNIVHYFSTPYLMMKNSLSKMNASWETTAMLMGDNWMKTIARVVTPNALSTLLEVFSYYFVNAMVTVSAVIFIAGARTMVITTKIQELQYFNEFNEIFVLSLLILFTNLIARAVFRRLAKMSESRQKTAKIYRFSEKKKAA